MPEYLREADYQASMRTLVEPYLAAVRQDGICTVPDGTALCYSLFAAEKPRGTVAIVHGFTETSEKYREMIYYFLREGYTVCVFDQRGHGHSPRTAPATVTHVEKFAEYVEDLHALLCHLGEALPSPRMLYSHSMGGAVSALYLIRHPGYFQKAVLSSPMIAPRHDGLCLAACRAICGFCAATGRRKKRIFVAPRLRPVSEETLEGSASDSAPRFEYYRALRIADPALCGGSPSYAWTYEALGVTRDILAKGAPEGIDIPVLLFSAEQDALVQEKPQKKFIARIPHGELVRVPTKHEIYASKDATLYPYLDRIFAFFKK